MAYVKGIDFEEMVIRTIFRRDLANVPTEFYIGLGRGNLPAKDADLGDIVEITGTGYARIALPPNDTAWPVIQQVNGDWKVSSLLSSFIAGAGGWPVGQATFVFLTDVASGTAGRFFGAVTIDPHQFIEGDEYAITYEYRDA